MRAIGLLLIAALPATAQAQGGIAIAPTLGPVPWRGVRV